MLRDRVLTAAAGIPVFIGFLYFGGPYLMAALLAVTLAGAWEYFRFADGRVLPAGGLSALAALWLWPQAIGGAAVVGLAEALVRRRGFSSIAQTVIGVFYLGLFRYLLLFREERGFLLTLGLVLSLWANDSAAYFAGTAYGRHRLAPRISPKKSVEGAIVGIVAGTGVFTAAGYLAGNGSWHWVPLGLLVSIASQAGDLFESYLKRRAGVKDSGTLLPGHGGALDRFDGLLFAVPAAYWLLKLL